MNRRKRDVIIAGNWKMNKTVYETEIFIKDISRLVKDVNCTVLFCVPYTNISCALKEAKGSNICIAAQNCHFEKFGAFTGEVSAFMLKELGVEYVLIGHSERRQYFAETDATVNLRLKAALKEGLKAIVCVGESLRQRQDGITFETISTQLKLGLKGLSEQDIKSVVLAYEPIWAIGTGETASADQAEQVCIYMRTVLETIFSKTIAQEVSILYGGSMNAKNCNDLLLKEDIDGGLIGGASLEVESFYDIVKTAESIN